MTRIHFKLQSISNHYGLAVSVVLPGKSSHLLAQGSPSFNKRGKDGPMSHSFHPSALRMSSSYEELTGAAAGRAIATFPFHKPRNSSVGTLWAGT